MRRSADLANARASPNDAGRGVSGRSAATLWGAEARKRIVVCERSGFIYM